MLVLMKKAASIELDQAVSAEHDAITSNSFLSAWEAAQWIQTCDSNLAEVAFKQRSLDEHGVYVFTGCQHVVHLTEVEKQ